MAQYNYTVRYKPGAQNTAADALSRRTDYNKAPKKLVQSADQLGLPLCEYFYFDETKKTALIEVVDAQQKHSESRSIESGTSNTSGTSNISGSMEVKVDGTNAEVHGEE